MVVAGETDFVPPAVGVTAPTPLLMEALVAFVVVHERVADCPLAMLDGLAERVQVGEPGGGVTVTGKVKLPELVRSALATVPTLRMPCT